MTTIEPSQAGGYVRFDGDEAPSSIAPEPAPSCFSRAFHAVRRYVRGVVPAPVRIIFALLSVAQEMPVTALGYVMTDELHFGPEEITAYYAMTYTPWLLKSVYAFFADNVPILGYRRRPYVMIFAFFSGFIFFAMATWAKDHVLFSVFGVANSLSICFCEVMMDGTSVELGNELKWRLKLREAEQARTEAALAAAAGSNASGPNAAADTQSSTGQDEAASPTPESAHTVSLIGTSAVPFPHHAPHYEGLAAEPATPLPGSGDVAARSLNGGGVNASAHGPAAAAAARDLAAGTWGDGRPSMLANVNEADVFASMTSATARAAIQSECMTVRSVGSLIAAAVSLVMLKFVEPRTLVLFTPIVSVCTIVTALWIPDFPRTVGVGSHFLSEGKVADGEAGASSSAVSASDEPEEEFDPAIHMADGEQYEYCGDTMDAMLQSEKMGFFAVGATQPAPLDMADGATAAETQPLTAPADSQPRRYRPRLTCCSCSLLARAALFRTRVVLRAALMLIRPTLFVFLANCMPTYTDSYYGYMYSFTFPKWMMSFFTFVSLVGSLLGSMLYWKFFSKVSLRKVFVLSTVFSLIGTVPTLLFTSGISKDTFGISHEVWVPFANFCSAIFGRIALMPTIVLAAESCPPQLGLESSMFSVFTSVSHAASYVSIAISLAFIRHFHLSYTDYSQLTNFMLVCVAFSVVPLFTLPILPRPQEEEKVAAAVTITDLMGLPPIAALGGKTAAGAAAEAEAGEDAGAVAGTGGVRARKTVST
jgi:hypothetical protein